MEEERKNVRLIAVFDTLEYLKRGGRLSRGKAFVGTVLSLKPIITITDGEVEVLDKVRGAKMGNQRMDAYLAEQGGLRFDRPYCLGYTGLSDEKLCQYIAGSKALCGKSKEELSVTHVGAVIGTYAGPGAIAVAFLV